MRSFGWSHFELESKSEMSGCLLYQGGRAVMELLEPELAPRRFLAHAMTRFDNAMHAGHFSQHPRKIVRLNPLEITRSCRLHVLTKRTTGSKWSDWGRIEGSDWDDTSRPGPNTHLDDTIIHQSVRARFIEGLSWEQTGVIDAKVLEIAKSGSIDGCFSREDLLRRYRKLDAVFEDILKNGWKLSTYRQDKLTLASPISVSITRYGEFMLGEGGAHRLAFAKVLRLQTIPVLVLMRHARWQELLDRCACGDAPPAVWTHPDVGVVGRISH